MEKLFERDLLKVPNDIMYILKNNHEIIFTEFEDKNVILTDKNLQNEIGYSKDDKGGYLVAMTCKMPNVTMDMIDWWFWWHPQDSFRYRMWMPSDHREISYANKDKAYFNAKRYPGFKPNTQFPVERISAKKLALRIDFLRPKDFGFDENLFEKNQIAGIVCGHVGMLGGIIMHTEMAHIFVKSSQGLFLASRFWLGEKLENRFLKSQLFDDKVAFEMTKHCCLEYRNLVKILPKFYEKYAKV